MIDQILNDDDPLILTDDLQDDMNLVATIGILPVEFAVKENQLIQLDGDVLVKEATWAALANEIDTTKDQPKKKEKDDIEGVIKFEKPQLTRHLSRYI